MGTLPRELLEMMDVVYVLREANWNPSLKLSLRSLNNIKHGKVFTVGHTPVWVQNTIKIDVKQGEDRFRNTTRNLIAACEHPELSDEFILMNDDFYILRQIDDIPVYHRGLLGPLAEAEDGGPYRKQRKEAYEYLLSLGIEEPLNYDLHIPMVVNKHKMLEILKDLKKGHSHKRSVYGNIVRLGGEFMNDVKIHGNDDFDPTLPFLSSNTDAIDHGLLGKFLKKLFKEKSIYEE